MTPTPEPSELDAAPPDPDFLAAFQQVSEQLQAGEIVDEETILREYPQFASALCQALPGLRAVASLAAQMRGCEPDDLSGTVLAGYQIKRTVGRGGMGTVYEACQLSLGHRVALKVLPQPVALDSRARRRFLREAEAIASLDHEHIVPSYALEISGTRPFFAMKFIDGHSLAELIRVLTPPVSRTDDEEDKESRPEEDSLAELARRLFEDALDPGNEGRRCAETLRVWTGDQDSPGNVVSRGSAPDSRMSPPQTLTCVSRSYINAVARLGVQAADALEHAHVSGVIHRDIKSANFLLDLDGHLWLTDFGLAWLRGHDATSLSAPVGGTLPYMSPEQLSPGSRPIDHRTDIYSLGVTLYELLTLHRPFPADEDHREQAIARILQADPVGLRKLNPAVPRDLETIIKVAMAKDRDERFDTSKAMAGELRLFLAGKRLTVRRPSPWSWLGKWVVKHRLGVSIWAATVVLLLVGSVGLLALQNRRLLRANAEATTQRLLAEGRLGNLRTANAELRHAAEMLAKTLPHDAAFPIEFYQMFINFLEDMVGHDPEAKSDPDLHYSLGLAHFQLARALNLHRRGEHIDQVLDHFDRSIAVLERVTRAHPERPFYRYDLGMALHSRGGVHLARTDIGDGNALALRDRSEALEALEALARDEPENADWQNAAAWENVAVGAILLKLRRVAEAESRFNQSIEAASRLSETFPQKLIYRATLAQALGSLASLETEDPGRTRLGDAESSSRRSIEINRGLVRADPGNGVYQYELASGLRGLSEIMRRRSRTAESVPILREALAISESLATRDPDNDGFLALPLKVLADLASMHFTLEYTAESEATYRKTITRCESLLRERPDLQPVIRLLKEIYETCPVVTLRDPERAKALLRGKDGTGPGQGPSRGHPQD